LEAYYCLQASADALNKSGNQPVSSASNGVRENGGVVPETGTFDQIIAS
jgi:hypothetical protein